MALDDKKLPPDLTADPAIAADFRGRLESGLLPCQAAFDAAGRLGVGPGDVGRTADALAIRLTRCQLGLFGFPGHAKGWAAAGATERPIPSGLKEALLAARDGRGDLSCLAIWREAERFGVDRIQAGYVADSLGVPIRHCQLGAF
ncbi:MAG: hypothetical protein NTZ26_13265 [Candidatus Aminicenantes bacterium]|nr:hypothetical protein [Candidatus Aminicenantes bacterium]